MIKRTMMLTSLLISFYSVGMSNENNQNGIFVLYEHNRQKNTITGTAYNAGGDSAGRLQVDVDTGKLSVKSDIHRKDAYVALVKVLAAARESKKSHSKL